MEHFTPWSALAGGALIGAGATLLYWLNGRIAGVSGICGGLLAWARGDTAWRAWFVVGLVLGTGLYAASGGLAFEPRDHWPLAPLIAGGFLVGFGTRLGSGCTSGHGVCGLARGSRRSLAATVTFMVTAVLTATLLTPLWVGG
jgi:uncharacterized membrane protein YedE/YeeE